MPRTLHSTGAGGHDDLQLCGSPVEPAECLIWQKHGYDIVRCSVCRLMFRHPLPRVEELPALYGVDYFAHSEGEAASGEGYASYTDDAPLHRANGRRRLERLERLQTPGRLLDVGCAAGFFVDEAARRGWFAEGIDVSAAMIEWGRGATQGELAVGEFTALEQQSSLYAAITMWDYLEHTLDPAAELQKAYELLEPQGILALATGNASSLVARLSGVRWHLLTPRHHNYFFTKQTLVAYCRKTAFEVIEVRHSPALYSLRHVTYKLRTFADVAIVKTLAEAAEKSRLSGIRIPINLYDIATVICRKRTPE